jgi:hypothetical protein
VLIAARGDSCEQETIRAKVAPASGPYSRPSNAANPGHQRRRLTTARLGQVGSSRAAHGEAFRGWAGSLILVSERIAESSLRRCNRPEFTGSYPLRSWGVESACRTTGEDRRDIDRHPIARGDWRCRSQL